MTMIIKVASGYGYYAAKQNTPTSSTTTTTTDNRSHCFFVLWAKLSLRTLTWFRALLACELRVYLPLCLDEIYYCFAGLFFPVCVHNFFRKLVAITFAVESLIKITNKSHSFVIHFLMIFLNFKLLLFFVSLTFSAFIFLPTSRSVNTHQTEIILCTATHPQKRQIHTHTHT